MQGAIAEMLPHAVLTFKTSLLAIKKVCWSPASFMKYIHVFHLRKERLGHPSDVQIHSR